MSNNNGAEISLRANSFCNLTTVDVSNIESQEDLNGRVRAATFIGTLQAGYTDFHYLRDIWKTTTEEDSLLGVSMTGIASGEVLKYNIKEASIETYKENLRVAELIGINPAKRITAIKPEGTSSLVAGCSSGIHAYFAPYYIRRMRVNKNEDLYGYLKGILSDKFLEDDYFKPNETAVLSMPIKSPEGAIFRDESEIDLLERAKLFHTDWIWPTHTKGNNKNNVSVTVSIKDGNWGEVGDWMWDNKDLYTGISVLPYDGGTYPQLPFEDTTREVYNEMCAELEAVDIDLTKIVEEFDNTDLSGEQACGAGGCEVK